MKIDVFYPPFPAFCLFTILSIHLPPYLPCSVFPVCGLLIRSYLPFTPLIYLVRYFPVCGLLLLPLFTLYNISQSVICCHVLIYRPVHSPHLIYLVQYFPVCDLQLRSYLPSCPFTSPLFTLNNISQSVICCHVLIYHPVQSPLFTFLSFVVTFLFTILSSHLYSPSCRLLSRSYLHCRHQLVSLLPVGAAGKKNRVSQC